MVVNRYYYKAKDGVLVNWKLDPGLVIKSNGIKRSTVTTGLLCKIGKTGTREGGIAMDITK